MADWAGIQRIMGMTLGNQRERLENQQREADAIRGREESALRQFGVNPRNMSHKQVASAYDILLNEQKQLAATKEQEARALKQYKFLTGIRDEQKKIEDDKRAKLISLLTTNQKAGIATPEQTEHLDLLLNRGAGTKGVNYTTAITPKTAEQIAAEEQKAVDEEAAALKDERGRNQGIVDTLTEDVVMRDMMKRYSFTPEDFADINSELHTDPSKFKKALKDYFLWKIDGTTIEDENIANDWTNHIYTHMKKRLAKEPETYYEQIKGWILGEKAPPSKAPFIHNLYPKGAIPQGDAAQRGPDRVEVTAENLNPTETYAWYNSDNNLPNGVLNEKQTDFIVAFENMVSKDPKSRSLANVLLAVATQESNLGAIDYNEITSATGPFQFVNETAYEIIRKGYFDDEGVADVFFNGIDLGNIKITKDDSFREVRRRLKKKYPDPSKDVNAPEIKLWYENIKRFVLDPSNSIQLAHDLLLDNLKVWRKSNTGNKDNALAAIASHHLGVPNLKKAYKEFFGASQDGSRTPDELIPPMRAKWESFTAAQKNAMTVPDRRMWDMRVEFIDWWGKVRKNLSMITSFNKNRQ